MFFKRKCERTVRMGIKITSNIILSFKHIFFNQNENFFFFFLLFLTGVQIQEVFQQPSQFNHPVVTRDPFGIICFFAIHLPCQDFYHYFRATQPSEVLLVLFKACQFSSYAHTQKNDESLSACSCRVLDGIKAQS